MIAGLHSEPAGSPDGLAGLLRALSGAGLSPSLDAQGRLCMQGPREALVPELLAGLRQHAGELREVLRAEGELEGVPLLVLFTAPDGTERESWLAPAREEDLLAELERAGFRLMPLGGWVRCDAPRRTATEEQAARLIAAAEGHLEPPSEEVLLARLASPGRTSRRLRSTASLVAVADPVPFPEEACACCGSPRFWRDAAAGAVWCATCYPPLEPGRASAWCDLAGPSEVRRFVDRAVALFGVRPASAPPPPAPESVDQVRQAERSLRLLGWTEEDLWGPAGLACSLPPSRILGRLTETTAELVDPRFPRARPVLFRCPRRRPPGGDAA